MQDVGMNIEKYLNQRNMKIKIQEELSFGGFCCGCTVMYEWVEKEVTPEELVWLIDHCKTIKI